jgi:hypothetical protein
MTISDIITVLFCLTMIANVVALVRHWQMMRVMQIVLNGLAETQREFNELQRGEYAPPSDFWGEVRDQNK